MSGHGFTRFDSAPGMLLAGIRRKHPMATAHVSVPEQWAEFRRLGLSGGQMLGAYCGMSDNGFEYMTGREVESFEHLHAEIDRMRIPAQEYAIFSHRGNVRKIGSTWESIWRDWLPRSGYEDAETPPLEVYGAGFDADTGEGGLEIWFPVRKAAPGSAVRPLELE